MSKQENKRDIIQKFGRTENDTGSSEVQVAILCKRIRQISEHLKQYPKDKHSLRGLMKLIGKRRIFLSYIKRKDAHHYETFTKSLKDSGY